MACHGSKAQSQAASVLHDLRGSLGSDVVDKITSDFGTVVRIHKAKSVEAAALLIWATRNIGLGEVW